MPGKQLWRRMIVPGSAEAFLVDVVLAETARQGEPAPAADPQWLSGERERLLERYPEADRLALRWLLNETRRTDLVRKMGEDGEPKADPVDFLSEWCCRFPLPGHADMAEPVVRAALERLTDSARTGGMLRLLAGLEAADGEGMPACRALLLEAARAHARERTAGGAGARAESRLELVAEACARPLLAAGLLFESELDELLLERPELVRSLDSFPQVAAAVGRFGRRVAAGEADPHLLQAIQACRVFHGIDLLLAACRELEQHQADALPLSASPDPGAPGAWAVHVLRHIGAPGPEDAARSAELGGLQPGTLLTAALLAPDWAPLIEPHLEWPGLATAARWLCDASRGGDAAEATARDRGTLLAATGRMGDKRLQRLFAHPLARQAYRSGFYYLKAILGRNTADVEKSFRNGDRPAIRALGLLPDEGDILERYMSLLKFARQLRRFKEAEHRDVEAGLTNLAVTAGYSDLQQLEWALEQHVANMQPDRRWRVGRYVLRVEPTEAAPILVEKEGKPLRTVPVELRKTAEYAEVQAVQEQIRAQWVRVPRRLEAAMASGAVVSRHLFLPLFRCPAGQELVPRLVLRCRLIGGGEPVDLLNFRTLLGDAVDVETIERFQVVHPMQLQADGTLAAWQRRLVQLGVTQPFNQLFREVYSAPEGTADRRLAGRRVKGAELAERLRPAGWKLGNDHTLRRGAAGGVAVLQLAFGSRSDRRRDVMTVSELRLPPEAADIVWSEVIREVELATRATAHTPADLPVTPETLGMRRALAAALVPGATVDGETAGAAGYTVHLGTGAVAGPEGGGLPPERPAVPEYFPYESPDAETALVIARLRQAAGTAVA